jgi:hypothetical protein
MLVVRYPDVDDTDRQAAKPLYPKKLALEHFLSRRSYGQSVARSGLKSLAQGLPGVALPIELALKGP